MGNHDHLHLKRVNAVPATKNKPAANSMKEPNATLYPGMYVPNPLMITVYEQDSSPENLCDEIRGLTTMNWNNTQMDGRLPITLECVRKIGDIMKYVSPTEKVAG